MQRIPCGSLAIGLVLVALNVSEADEPAAAEGRKKSAAAIERGAALVEKGARSYPTHRKCFACHHQTLPLLALSEARASQAKVDEEFPGSLVDFTTSSFRRQIDDLVAGENIGGKGLTVGYGIWALRLAGTKPDDLTAAMAAYLLKTQEEDGHWDLHAIRPPGEESLVMCAVLAASGLAHYAADAERERAAAAVDKARTWLAAAKLESHEDRVAQLWGVKLLHGSDADLSTSRQAVVDSQREDGGWGQTAEMESDAYATGSALYVLLDTGLAPADSKIERAIEYLLKTQLEDGSWHVKSRAKPVQAFFDNGDPHGKDQFISISATCWSVAALAKAIREK
jgi:N-acyl-D-amino-acid deacylase